MPLPGDTSILNGALVNQAIDLATPSAELIINSRGMYWGPNGGVLTVATPQFSVVRVLGNEEDVNKEWDRGGGFIPNFHEISRWKANAVLEHGMSTRMLKHIFPWCYSDNDYLFIGGVGDKSLAVAFSGLNSEADEGISGMVRSIVTMLCHQMVILLDNNGTKKVYASV